MAVNVLLLILMVSLSPAIPEHESLEKISVVGLLSSAYHQELGYSGANAGNQEQNGVVSRLVPSFLLVRLRQNLPETHYSPFLLIVRLQLTPMTSPNRMA